MTKVKKIGFCVASFAALSALDVAAAPASAATDVKPRDYYGKIAVRLANMLNKNHVLQQKLDDEVSRRAWTNLVTYYDYDHSVFLKSDLDRFARHEKTIDDEIKAGDVSFGFDVHNCYVERLRERILFATNLLAKADWDFSRDESYRIRRKDAPWPETRAEAEEHWRKRMKNEILSALLTRELDAEDAKAEEAKKKARGEKAECEGRKGSFSPAISNRLQTAIGQLQGMVERQSVTADRLQGTVDGLQAAVDELKAIGNPQQATGDGVAAATNDAPTKADTPEETLIKKYRQYAMVLMEPDEEAVLQHYLSAVARAYDPHTDYMSPASKEDFDMEMNLSLCGVGAVLSMEDGALKIVEVMTGGPMDRDGRIKTGDKIVGVKQGDGPMEDVTWQPMKKSISKIRGKKGTRVTLEIIPRADSTGMAKKRIELVRDEIKLEDQAATGRVERVSVSGRELKLGYVYLPGFYGTMDKRPSDPSYRSCSLDVNRYLASFNAEGVEGLVLDLRGNGGGSLREAVFLSALFVAQGPVVQIRDIRTVGCLPIPPGNAVAFRKPMVVLTDRASASASEIVAGHLQDVDRALVLGDGRTHGKGTVQTVLGMGPAQYGSMKITTARFYRITGRSTQVEGVAADIRLPSLLDSLDIGEDKLTYALPFSRILPADYSLSWNTHDHLAELRAKSVARLRNDARYRRHVENVDGMKRVSDRTEVPLERAARKRMMAADRDLRELDEEEDDGETEEKASKPARRKRNERAKDDVVLDEAFRILGDLVEANDGAEMPQPKGWWN